MEILNHPQFGESIAALIGAMTALGLLYIAARNSAQLWEFATNFDVLNVISLIAIAGSGGLSAAGAYGSIAGAPGFIVYPFTIACALFVSAGVILAFRGHTGFAVMFLVFSVMLNWISTQATFLWAAEGREIYQQLEARSDEREADAGADKQSARATAQSIRASIAAEENTLRAAQARQSQAIDALGQLPAIAENPELERLSRQATDLRARMLCEETAQPAGCLGESGPVAKGGQGPAYDRLKAALGDAEARLDQAKSALNAAQHAGAAQREAIGKSLTAAEADAAAARARLQDLQSRLDAAEARAAAASDAVSAIQTRQNRPWSTVVIDSIERIFVGNWIGRMLGMDLETAFMILGGVFALLMDFLSSMIGLRARIAKHREENAEFHAARKSAKLELMKLKAESREKLALDRAKLAAEAQCVGVLPNLRAQAALMLAGAQPAQTPAASAPQDAPQEAPPSELIKSAGAEIGEILKDIQKPAGRAADEKSLGAMFKEKHPSPPAPSKEKPPAVEEPQKQNEAKEDDEGGGDALAPSAPPRAPRIKRAAPKPAKKNEVSEELAGSPQAQEATKELTMHQKQAPIANRLMAKYIKEGMPRNKAQSLAAKEAWKRVRPKNSEMGLGR